MTRKALPTFCNLSGLEVGYVSRVVLRLLPGLLIKSCHLKVIVFAEGFRNEESDHDADLPLCYENVPACVSMHLKEIGFQEFSMQENECNLMKYFLKNARVLDKIIIQSFISWGKQFEFSKKLPTFPKFSRECQIIIDKKCAKEEQMLLKRKGITF